MVSLSFLNYSCWEDKGGSLETGSLSCPSRLTTGTGVTRLSPCWDCATISFPRCCLSPETALPTTGHSTEGTSQAFRNKLNQGLKENQRIALLFSKKLMSECRAQNTVGAQETYDSLSPVPELGLPGRSRSIELS